MSEPRLISPMLDGFIMGDPISDHAGVRCCPAMKNDTDDRYLVKIISNPASPKQLEALLLTGAYASAEEANDYFKSLTADVVAEIKVLESLSQEEGFLAYENHQVIPMEGGETGYDVYILRKYGRTLERLFNKEPLTHLGAINLGLDICSALSVCRRAGYLYADLKPSNIQIVNDSEYRIADLGFLKMDSLKYASLPDKYRSAYTAPEITDAFSSLNTTVDIYALGLILYRAYNGGQLPFSGDVATAEKFAPPAYADYEMSEIILKACDPDPEQRWQEPMQMGQALVSYMQRNGANDTPIVPPVLPQVEAEPEIMEQEDEIEPVENSSSEEPISTTDPEPVEDHPEVESEAEELPMDASVAAAEEASQDPIVFAEDDYGNLSFLTDEKDETTEEIAPEEIEYEEISMEVSEILTQVDEIAAHQVPDPVVAPEAVEITIPEPVVDTSEDEAEAEPPAEDSAEETAEEIVEPVAQDTDASAESTEEVNEEAAEETVEEDLEASDEEKPPKKHILRNVILGVLAAAVLAVGILFYNYYYLQRIDLMTVTGDESSVSVVIDTKIDHSKLNVICADIYGTKTTSPVVDGKATFPNLLGGTEYTITVTMDGFHKVIGDSKKTYFTPSLTNIIQFSAVTGSENGSVNLNFAVDGPDSAQWQVSYGPADEEPAVLTFEGHRATIKGLTVGKEYTIKLSSVDELYLSGNLELSHTASDLIYPENVAITSFKDKLLTVNWTAPENAKNEEWYVHCYNTAGYNETIATKDLTATFENIDNTQDYTVEISASGQSVFQRTTVEENSITLDNISASLNENGQIALSWNCSGDIPEGGWNVICAIDGTEFTSTYTCDANQIVILDTLPENDYTINIEAVNGAPVVCSPILISSGAAKTFSCDFGGAPISGNEISLSMCVTPNKENWTRNDLKKADYTTNFKVGQNASFVIRALKLYGISDDELIVTYAITDKDGKLISVQNEEFTWRTLWDYYYGEINIPSLPSVAGEYTVTIYFNSGLVDEQPFTISE